MFKSLGQQFLTLAVHWNHWSGFKTKQNKKNQEQYLGPSSSDSDLIGLGVTWAWSHVRAPQVTNTQARLGSLYSDSLNCRLDKCFSNF